MRFTKTGGKLLNKNNPKSINQAINGLWCDDMSIQLHHTMQHLWVFKSSVSLL